MADGYHQRANGNHGRPTSPTPRGDLGSNSVTIGHLACRHPTRSAFPGKPSG